MAVVGAGNIVHFRKLTVGRDLGTRIEVTGGLNGDERLVTSLSDDIREGVEVTVNEEKKSRQ